MSSNAFMGMFRGLCFNRIVKECIWMFGDVYMVYGDVYMVVEDMYIMFNGLLLIGFQ